MCNVHIVFSLFRFFIKRTIFKTSFQRYKQIPHRSPLWSTVGGLRSAHLWWVVAVRRARKQKKLQRSDQGIKTRVRLDKLTKVLLTLFAFVLEELELIWGFVENCGQWANPNPQIYPKMHKNNTKIQILHVWMCEGWTAVKLLQKLWVPLMWRLQTGNSPSPLIPLEAGMRGTYTYIKWFLYV